MDKNLLALCITFSFVLSLIFGSIMHSQYSKSNIAIASAESGLQQEMVKADGYAPRYIWVKKTKLDGE